MEVTDADFDEKVIKQSRKKIVVVDFWASWCVPCNMLAPILEKVVGMYGENVILAKVNVDECPETADRFGINAIPAVKIFKKGKIISEITGIVPEDTIKKKIDAALIQ